MNYVKCSQLRRESSVVRSYLAANGIPGVRCRLNTVGWSLEGAIKLTRLVDRFYGFDADGSI